MFERRAVPLHPEDQKIVEIAKELCGQLNYYRVSPETVTWRNRMGVRRVPADFFLVFPGRLSGSIQLSKAAMGKLAPEEWRPVLASGLIYYKNFGRRYLRGMLTTMIPVIILLIPALLLTFRYLSGDSFQSIATRDVVLSSLIALTLVQGARLMLYPKRLWFKADQQAARLIGKEALLSSLRKIGSIDEGTLKGRRGFVRPSVEERIRRLEDTGVGRS